MNDAASSKEDEEHKTPFIIKVRWIVIAILAYMLIFNYLLYKGTETESSNNTPTIAE